MISPVYRGVGTVAELHERLAAVAERSGQEMEFIFVDDASPDDSWGELARLVDLDPRVVAVRLRANVRQTRAIFAGTEVARGDALVVMDSDLDDPPEVVPELLARFADGHDLVVAERTRDGRTAGRGLGSALLNLLAAAARVPLSDIGSSFLVMSRSVEQGVRRELERTGVQLILPTNIAVSRNPTTVMVPTTASAASDYRLSALTRITVDFVAMYLATRLARALAGCAAVVALVGVGLRRRRVITGGGVLAALALGVLALRLRLRRDPDEPLYEVETIIDRRPPR